MRKKLLVIAVIGALTVGAAGFAFAGPWGFGARGVDCDPAERLDAIAGLNLTDEQYASIQGFMAESFERMTASRMIMSQKMHELQLMYWQKNPDSDAIAARHAEIVQLREQMREEPNVQEQIMGILGEDQQAAFEQMRGLAGFRGRPRGPGMGGRMARKGS